MVTSSAYLAVLSFLDTWFFLYLALYLKVNPLTLGIADSLWSAVFVISSALLGKFVEEGSNRSAAAVSSLMLCLAALVVSSSRDVAVVVLAYSLLHALSTSLGRVSANVTLLEYVDYERWSKYNYLINSAALALRGLLLALAYLGLLRHPWLLILVVPVSALYTAALPPIIVPIERTLFSIAKRLERVNYYIKFTSILPELIDADLTASRAFELRWSAWRDTPSYRPLLGIFILMASSSSLSIVVPKLLSARIGPGETILAYALASLASALVLALVLRASGRRHIALASGIARALVLPTALFATDVWQASAYLLVTAVLLNVFSASTYNAYVNSSAGQGISLFGVATELGCVVGSLVGGLLAHYWGVNSVIAFSIIGHLAASIAVS